MRDSYNAAIIAKRDTIIAEYSNLKRLREEYNVKKAGDLARKNINKRQKRSIEKAAIAENQLVIDNFYDRDYVRPLDSPVAVLDVNQAVEEQGKLWKETSPENRHTLPFYKKSIYINNIKL